LTALLMLSLAVSARAADPPYTVDRADIVQQVLERGALDAANAVDIVAPGGKDKPLVIKWVIEEGSQVKKGDRILEFDDSALREQLQQQQFVVDQASAGVVAA